MIKYTRRNRALPFNSENILMNSLNNGIYDKYFKKTHF